MAAVGTQGWHQLLRGQRGDRKEQPGRTIIFVLEGGGGVEKTMRGGMKISEEKSKVRGPNLPQLPMSSTPGLAGATLSKHGRGRWMLSQKQSCKPTQNAHGTGKEKYYSHVLKIRSLIRYQESGAGSALLPPPGDAVWAQMCTVCGRAGAQE